MTGAVDVLRVDMRASGAADVVLNRPERLNALDPALLGALAAEIPRLADDDRVRAVVVRGAGRAFCAGGDMRSSAGTAEPLTVDERARRLRLWAGAAEALRSMPKPTLAAVRGPAVGAGLGLALACDLRLAAPSAAFSAGYVKVGLSGDFATAWSLTTHLGGSRARMMLLTGEPLTAEDAHRAGLVWRIVPDGELEIEAHRAIDRLASGPRLALASIKANVACAEGEPDWHGEALHHETARDTPDHAEGRLAFAERRDPVYTAAK